MTRPEISQIDDGTIADAVEDVLDSLHRHLPRQAILDVDFEDACQYVAQTLEIDEERVRCAARSRRQRSDTSLPDHPLP